MIPEGTFTFPDDNIVDEGIFLLSEFDHSCPISSEKGVKLFTNFVYQKPRVDLIALNVIIRLVLQ